MTGGILQLVAKNPDDTFLTDKPDITMFKSVFRRHSNFSKSEQVLNFNGKLTFGKTVICKIKKLADLVGKMTLVIDLPDVNISYIPLTNQELYNLLVPYEIYWNYTEENKNHLITQEEFESVVGLIEYIDGKMTRQSNGMILDKIAEITKQIERDDAFIQTIETLSQQYIDANNTDIVAFLDDLKLNMLLTNRNLFIDDTDYINQNDYYNQYNYLYSYKKDLNTLLPRQVIWLNDPRNVTSFYDVSNGLPPQVPGDRYVSSTDDRSWITNNIYRWDNTNWVETIPELGNGLEMVYGFKNVTTSVLRECFHFNKILLGFFNPNSAGLPPNPSVGDKYIASENQTPSGWLINHVYNWNGNIWEEIALNTGIAYYVNGTGNTTPNYFEQLIYYNGLDWITYAPTAKIMYDGTQWRKSVVSFYDPTDGLPAIIVPDSIGYTYVATNTANSWTNNYLYTWDGTDWIETIPVNSYGVYVENGEIYTGNIMIFNGYAWEILNISVPIYDSSSFKQVVYTEMQKLLFTDSNIKLLYGIENFNTTVIPTTATLTTRTFFDNMIVNEIGTIDTQSALYISSYNTYFDTSLVDSQAHVLTVQAGLSTDARSKITNVINPNIQMMTSLYERLNYADAPDPSYYRFIYYKYYPYTGSYDTSQTIFNCPRAYYATPLNSLKDHFASTLLNITGTTDYITTIKNLTNTFIGTSSSAEGNLYNVLMESRISTFFENYFINTDTSYATALDGITVTGISPDNRKIYNLAQCLNILTEYSTGRPIKTNLYLDYQAYFTALNVTLPSPKNTMWYSLLSNVLTYIHGNIPNVETTLFPSAIWNADDGIVSKTHNDYDRIITCIFKKFTPYDVHKLLPSEYTFVPEFTLVNKNPIEYLAITFAENLRRYTQYQNQYLSAEYTLSQAELDDIMNKLSYISYGYLDNGMQDYAAFVEHGTNLTSTIIPELYIPEVPPIESYHLPYDGYTAMMCYMINYMKIQFNTFYNSATTQSIYDAMGNPFMSANAQFVTNDDFYSYGDQMYNAGYLLINSLIDTYNNDMTRYETYGHALRIKKLYLEPLKYFYSYPLTTYVKIHQEIYNNQSIYINSTTDYDTVYTNVLTPLDSLLLPLLEYYNTSYGIFTSPLDLLIYDSTYRKKELLINPYSSYLDHTRYEWYNDKIVTNILGVETDFVPSQVGIYEYFKSSVNSLTNPFQINTNLYQWYDSLDLTYKMYEDVKMKKLFGIPYFSITALSFYDPTSSLPESPNTGDRYICSKTVNNTELHYLWTINRIYEWNSTSWTETIPVDGTLMYVVGGELYPKYYVMFYNNSWTTFGSEGDYSRLAVTPMSLYGDYGNIIDKYNSFDDITDCLNYFMDHIVKNSQVGNIISLFKATIESTRDALLNYYNTQKNAQLSILNKINPYILTNVNGSVQYSSLEDLIRKIYNREPVRFAWIQELGNYIIDYIDLLIDDAVIDHQSGEYMHIKAVTELDANRLNGYNKMIGNVPELYTFDNKKKAKYKLFIPLFFTLNLDYAHSLPLICMNNTNVSLRIKLKELNQVAYYDPLTKFTVPLNTSGFVVADYIYLTTEERSKNVANPQEQLIETIQPFGEVQVNLAELEDGMKTIKLVYTGMCKELYLVCQLDKYIDGTLPNGEKRWNEYLATIPVETTIVDGVVTTTTKKINPIESIEILFAGKEREHTKPIEYYSLAQRYAHHTSSNDDGISVYSFALYPELLQPTGAANLGKVGDVELNIKFRDELINSTDATNKVMRIRVYNRASNILRIMSGMAGLAFFS